VILNHSGNLDSDVIYSGAGVIRKQGGGDANMRVPIPGFTGQLDVVGGKVRPTSFDALGGTGGGTVVIASGGQLEIGTVVGANGPGFGTRLFKVEGNGPGDEGVISNTGSIAQQNAFQKVTLTGNATFNGGSAGRFDIRAAQVGGVNQARLDLAGFTLQKKGDNFFVLVATDVTDGNILINGNGSFQIETTTNIASLSASTNITLNGGTLSFNGVSGTVTRPMIINSGNNVGINASNTSTIGSNITLNSDLNLTNFNNNGVGTLVLNGNITETAGPRTLTKNNGPGTSNFTLVMNGNLSYTGQTNLNGGGTMRVNGTHATGAATYNVNGGNILGGSGTINGPVHLSGGATLSPGSANASVGAFSVASLTLDGGANILVELNSSGADRINVTATDGLISGGTTTFALANLGGMIPGTYTLIDYSGTALANPIQFGLGTTSLSGMGLSLNNNTAGTSIDLIVTGPTWNVDAAGNWTVAGNWTSNPNPAPNGIDASASFGPIITAPRTVTVDTARTVGNLNFNSPIAYTLGGTSTLTLDVSGSQATVNVTAGSHVISAAVVLNDNTTITSATGTGVAFTGPLTATGRTITKAGLGTAQFENVRATALNVSAGSAKISTKGTPNSAAGTSVVNSLSISTGANLDLANNSMIIDYTTLGTQLSDVRNHLSSGRLSSSSATATTRLGYGDNTVLGKTTFAGQTPDATSILIKYTYAGDSDLDGDADGVDIGTWAVNFTGELGGAGSSVWTQGDWDYDGDVDGVDAGLWATAFTGELGGGGLGTLVIDEPIAPGAAAILQGMGITVVPEPGTAGLLVGIGTVAMHCHCRRRRRK
jgi:hypothetical protein